MLHLTLAANILNAVGGQPDLTRPDFVPSFPTALPNGETDFMVDLQGFSPEAVLTFLKIERPRKAPEGRRTIAQTRSMMSPFFTLPAARASLLAGETEVRYYSIGEFYDAIDRGLEYLNKQGNIFTGNPSNQVTSEYYYSGGAKLFPVTDMPSAKRAIQLIIQQGEGGDPGHPYGDEGELGHYYRFQQLGLGRYYERGNEADKPSGPALQVEWDKVYPVKRNARIADYPEGSELRAAAIDFNQAYADFLKFITRAFNGEPSLLLEAVPQMFSFRNKMTRLIHNPFPGMEGLVNAAPTFEMAQVASEPAHVVQEIAA
jgi:hypothetical protein